MEAKPSTSKRTKTEMNLKALAEKPDGYHYRNIIPAELLAVSVI